MTHNLKTWPVFYDAVIAGIKTFEVRKDDRNFKEGDILLLQDYDPETDKFSGDQITVKVVYKMSGGKFGIAADYCVLGFEVE